MRGSWLPSTLQPATRLPIPKGHLTSPVVTLSLLSLSPWLPLPFPLLMINVVADHHVSDFPRVSMSLETGSWEGYDGPWTPKAMTVCSLDMPVSFPLTRVKQPSFTARVDHYICGCHAFSHISLCPTAPAHEQKSVHNRACPTRLLPLSDLLVAPHDLYQILLQLDRIFLCGSISHCTLISNVFFVLWDLRSGHHTSNSCAFSAGPSSGMSTSYSPSRKRLVHIDYWWFFNHCS